MGRYPEKHLPKPMRFGLPMRIFRFVFFLLALFFGILLSNYGNDKDAADYCDDRDKCQRFCTEDDYPNLECETYTSDIRITYKNDEYYGFYHYPAKLTSDNFNECYALTQEARFPLFISLARLVSVLWEGQQPHVAGPHLLPLLSQPHN